MKIFKLVILGFVLTILFYSPVKAEEADNRIETIKNSVENAKITVEKVNDELTTQNINTQKYRLTTISQKLSRIEDKLEAIKSEKFASQLEKEKFKETKRKNNRDIWLDRIQVALAFLTIIFSVDRVAKQIEAQNKQKYGEWKANLKQNIASQIYEKDVFLPNKAADLWELYCIPNPDKNELTKRREAWNNTWKNAYDFLLYIFIKRDEGKKKSEPEFLDLNRKDLREIRHFFKHIFNKYSSEFQFKDKTNGNTLNYESNEYFKLDTVDSQVGSDEGSG